MGAKVAMQMASEQEKKISALIVVDMSPKAYPVLHGTILSALNELSKHTPFARIKAEQLMFRRIDDPPMVRFLLKNLFWKTNDNGGIALAFRFNLKVITGKISNMGIEILFRAPVKIPALFVRGAKSDYMSDDDFLSIRKRFPKAKFETIKNAGHWVHADQPDEFFLVVQKFLMSF